MYRSGRLLNIVAELRARINAAMANLALNHDLFEKVRRNLEARLHLCLQNRGRHIEAGEQAKMLRAIGAHGSVLWV